MIAVRTSGKWAGWSGWWGARYNPTPKDVTWWVRSVANLYPSDGVAIIIRRES